MSQTATLTAMDPRPDNSPFYAMQDGLRRPKNQLFFVGQFFNSLRPHPFHNFYVGNKFVNDSLDLGLFNRSKKNFFLNIHNMVRHRTDNEI